MSEALTQTLCKVETLSALRGVAEAVAAQSEQLERDGQWKETILCEQFLIQTYELIAALQEDSP